MKKTIFLAVMLSLSSLLFAITKVYDVVIDSPAKAGTIQLAKGNYTVKVVGDQAVFRDEHFKTYSVAVKLDTNATKKFDRTSLEATDKDGTEVIKAIHLGGTKTTLEFGD
jgi:hypothetical protein